MQETLIARLKDRVDALAAAGTIGRNQHFILRATLLAALKLADRRARASHALMHVFVKQVDALLRDDALSESEAHSLLDPAATARLLLARAHGG